MATDPTYRELDCHRLRAGHGLLLDFALAPAIGSRTWIATIWPDHHHPGTWGRAMWAVGAGGRGWQLDPALHLGDVVEFGADTDTPERWYGYVTHADDISLSLVGPFDNPTDAIADGHASLAAWRRLLVDSGRPEVPR